MRLQPRMTLTVIVYVWKNCEYRSYQFDTAPNQVENNTLVETEESWRRRHGSQPRPTQDQQDEWRSEVYSKLEPLYAAMT